MALMSRSFDETLLGCGGGGGEGRSDWDDEDEADHDGPGARRERLVPLFDTMQQMR